MYINEHNVYLWNNRGQSMHSLSRKVKQQSSIDATACFINTKYIINFREYFLCGF